MSASIYDSSNLPLSLNTGAIGMMTIPSLSPSIPSLLSPPSSISSLILSPPLYPSLLSPLLDPFLPRFRLRYCAVNDCYYLHWDNAVCPPLARIEGFMNGLHSASGVRRQFDEAEGKVGCVRVRSKLCNL